MYAKLTSLICWSIKIQIGVNVTICSLLRTTWSNRQLAVLSCEVSTLTAQRSERSTVLSVVADGVRVVQGNTKRIKVWSNGSLTGLTRHRRKLVNVPVVTSCLV